MGREGKRERNIDVWLHLARPQLGTLLQPRHVPQPGVKPATLGPQAGPQSTEPHQPGQFWVF